MTEATAGTGPALSVEHLDVEVAVRGAWRAAVTDVSFSVGRGEMTALVGESGSGKTLTGMAIMGLLEGTARRTGGTIDVDGVRLAGPAAPELRQDRRRGLAMVFQNPMTSLNPAFRVGSQVVEAIRRHDQTASKREAWERAVELLRLVEIRNPDRAVRQYPHEFSGGMQQRAMFAIAVACQPKVLIADEPTTALDVTVQKGVMDLLDRLRQSLGLSVVFISHNLALVSGRCERVLVMYAGELVESGGAAEVLADPRHPYTRGLLRCTPDYALKTGLLEPLAGRVPGPGETVEPRCRFAARCRFAIDACVEHHPTTTVAGPGRSARCIRIDEVAIGELSTNADSMLVLSGVAKHETRGSARSSQAPVGDVLLTIHDVSKAYTSRRAGRRSTWVTKAVDNVSLQLGDGESLGLVGESGSGKTTLGRIACGLIRPDAGAVILAGHSLYKHGKTDRSVWRDVQMIFQDPYSSLNPSMSVGDNIAEPIRRWHSKGHRDALLDAQQLLERVGLDHRLASASPMILSGGQRQRVSIARAIAARPRLIICDEAVSALDVSVQAQIVLLLRDLQKETGIAYLFITHDVSLVRIVADRVIVMSEGVIVETCNSDELTDQAVTTDIARRLLAAVPVLETEQTA